MKLRARPVNIGAGGKAIVILNKLDADELGVHDLERVRIRNNSKSIIAIVDVSERFIHKGEAATNDTVTCLLNIKDGQTIVAEHVGDPESVTYIKQKLAGERLNYYKIKVIIKDVVNRNLSDIELTSFITALHLHGMSMDEIESLSRSMVETGKRIVIPGKTIVDKHSIGGVPGDKTTMVSVPIIAAAGLTIPKTSSRAITSPAGTADRMEVLAPVTFTADEIKRIVKRTGGCMVWGGALDLAPADDAIIQVEIPLGIDPMLLPSIMSKKKSVGAKYVVIDIPTGRGTKVKTVGAAHSLADDFIELGRRMSMKVACAVTYGEQPLGHAVGPALEAREALETLMNRGPYDVIEKTTQVAGVLFDLVGKTGVGRKHAMQLLESGKALKKMREIIDAQGGDRNVRPSDIPLGRKSVDIRSKKAGHVLWMDNTEIALIAREAGAPQDKGAGVYLHAKRGDAIKKGQKLFTIYSDNNTHMANAVKAAEENEPIVVAKSLEERMLLSKVPSLVPHKRIAMIER